MNKLTLLLGVILCLAVVSARHVREERSETLNDDEEEESLRRSHKPRTRRRRWPMNYGYDVPSYINRRDYERDNSEVILNIYKLLEDIAANVRRQSIAPPPQPIYIPYPVPYPFGQTACKPNTVVQIPANKRPGGSTDKPTTDPDVFSRFPAMEDTNQNWGFVPEDEPEDDLGDGTRPISFDPISPKQVMQRPAPQVEHGSQQASSLPSQKRDTTTTKPGMCNAAILSCCFSSDIVQQKNCFTSAGCSSLSSDNTNACSSDSIQRALNSFKAAYSPSQ